MPTNTDKPANQKPIKLRKSRRSVFQIPPGGGQFVITGKPIDGKPGVLVEYPDGSKVWHETLTPNPASGSMSGGESPAAG